MCRLLLITVTALMLVSPALAQNATEYVGEVTGQDVYVRSGPDRSWYEVTQLSAAAQGPGCGAEGEWLKIVPPEGCFSLVNKQFVKRDGDIGTIMADKVVARAGSLLRPGKADFVQGQFSRGATVAIIGETDEYYKIKPTGAAVVYINSSYVRKPGAAAPVGARRPASRPAAAAAAMDNQTVTMTRPRTTTTRPGETISTTTVHTTVTAVAAKPSSAAKAAYDQAVKDLNDEYKKPLDKRDYNETDQGIQGHRDRRQQFPAQAAGGILRQVPGVGNRPQRRCPRGGRHAPPGPERAAGTGSSASN